MSENMLFKTLVREIVKILNKIEGLSNPLYRGRTLDIDVVEAIVDCIIGERLCGEVEILSSEAVRISANGLAAIIWYHPQLDGWIYYFD